MHVDRWMIHAISFELCCAENFMEGYRMVFDWENKNLGWSRSKCKLSVHT